MCGRYTISKSQQQVELRFGATASDGEVQAKFNAAPTNNLPVITNQEMEKIQFFRWGLVPFWAKDLSFGNKAINARVETIIEKPAFQEAAASRRCLVPADGYYEWKKVGNEKRPHWLYLKSKELFAMAGLWEEWTSPEGQMVNTFTIITRPAPQALAHIHDRMPVILSQEQEKKWLQSGIEAIFEDGNENVVSQQSLEFHPVSPKVGQVKNDGEELIKLYHYPTQGTLF